MKIFYPGEKIHLKFPDGPEPSYALVRRETDEVIGDSYRTPIHKDGLWQTNLLVPRTAFSGTYRVFWYLRENNDWERKDFVDFLVSNPNRVTTEY
jgi:hypothetical protein